MEASSAGDSVEIQLDLTAQDYTRFYRWHVSHRAGMRIALAVSVVIVVCLTILGLRESGRQRIGDFIVVATAIAYWLIVLPSSIARAGKRSFATHQAAQESHRVVIAAGGIASASSSTSGQQSWGVFWKAVEVVDAFYLHLSNALAVVLPKRCFTSEEQMQRFRGIVRAGMGERAKGIRG